MYLLFNTDYTLTSEPIPIGDGSYLRLVTCEEGYFITDNFKSLVDEQDEWIYTEVESITPYNPDPLEI
jgi:hypothetical protein